MVLENVRSAPWPEIVQKFKLVGYHAQATMVDTKEYYIPQTRTRGYLFACRADAFSETTLEEWTGKFAALKRLASAPIDAFLLDDEDHRVALLRSSVKEGSQVERPWEKAR